MLHYKSSFSELMGLFFVTINKQPEYFIFMSKFFNISISNYNFYKVKEHLITGLKKEVDDNFVYNWLISHPDILGLIIAYDEVETEVRNLIWDKCND